MNAQRTLATVVLGLASLTAVGAEPAAWRASQPQNNAAGDPWTQKQFIITFWCPPPATDKALAAVAAENYNLTWVPADGLDMAAKHHLRAMLTSELLSPAVLDDPAKRPQLDALIEKVKKQPALEAYYLVDEPGAAAFPGLGKLVAYLRQRDPAHLAYINLFPTYANEAQLGVTAAAAKQAKVRCPSNLAGVGPDDATVLAYREHLRQFVEIVKPDLISYDHYHFFKGNDAPDYFLNLALIRLAAIEANRPFLNIIQASLVVPAWRLPNPAESRFLVFTTMAYGGRGISYFTYWGPKSYGGIYQDGEPSPMAREIATINAEIEKLGPALMALESLAVYHTPPLPRGTEAAPADAPVQIVGGGECVLGLFGKSGSRGATRPAEAPSAFMVVNRSYKQATEASVKIAAPTRSVQELDRKVGKWSQAQPLRDDRIVQLKLQPGDGRLFRLTE